MQLLMMGVWFPRGALQLGQTDCSDTFSALLCTQIHSALQEESLRLSKNTLHIEFDVLNAR